MYLEIICLILIFVCYTFFRQKGSDKFPPGPMQLPLIGNIYQIGIHPFKTFLKMKAKYGNIIGIKGPGFCAVVLNDPIIIREALNMTEFSGRMYCAAFSERFVGDGNQGIILNEGKALYQHRRFFLKTARNFGYGKGGILESLIQVEITELIEKLVKLNGKFQPENAFNLAVLNSLWTIVAGHRFAYTDTKLLRIVHLFNHLWSKMPFSGAFLFFPKIYNLAPEFTGYKSLMDMTNELLDLVRYEYDEHLKTFQKDEPRDYLDCYVQENLECEDTNSALFGDISKHNILPVLWDLFGAAFETTSSTLTWAIMYLSLNPIVQQKMFKEIKTVVGISRLPYLIDRQSMPYVEATIMEILRMSSFFPFAVMHRATETINLQGYVIPKDTVILPNLYGAHHDPVIWGDPEVFRPERFINDDGKVISHKALLPFGIGKRACLGETLAKDQLFLFLTSLVQKFRIEINPDKPKPDPTQFKYSFFILLPQPSEYILFERF